MHHCLAFICCLMVYTLKIFQCHHMAGSKHFILQTPLLNFKRSWGNSLLVQWLGLRALTARGPGSIPGWRTKIPQDTWHGQKKKKKELGHIKGLYSNQWLERKFSEQISLILGVFHKSIQGYVVLCFPFCETGNEYNLSS